MFEWLWRMWQSTSSTNDTFVQPHGQVFAWRKGVILTAVDEVVLALPKALFDPDRPLSELLFGPDDMQIDIHPEQDRIFIRLIPGMSVSLAKSTQTYVFADDEKPRRIRIEEPPA